ncbi:hypothetical protein WICPIJ_003143 [Wickerhamomyces pijperi]|uniref:Uncharacterized protein n=1 Tax=Wickerhamomyces pijperi TaxID=599730 RepID=A0A9P8QAB5_WICPI|nr:hypothetical protein WICPIJ_003143 [Wickerhamomyces pijperi]
MLSDSFSLEFSSETSSSHILSSMAFGSESSKSSISSSNSSSSESISSSSEFSWSDKFSFVPAMSPSISTASSLSSSSLSSSLFSSLFGSWASSVSSSSCSTSLELLVAPSPSPKPVPSCRSSSSASEASASLSTTVWKDDCSLVIFWKVIKIWLDNFLNFSSTVITSEVAASWSMAISAASVEASQFLSKMEPNADNLNLISSNKPGSMFKEPSLLAMETVLIEWFKISGNHLKTNLALTNSSATVANGTNSTTLEASESPTILE